MAILSRGQSFASGDQVTAQKLQDLVDGATFSDPADEQTIQLDSSTNKLKVPSNGIGSNQLASHASTDSSRAVGTDHIKDGSVTAAKLDSAAVSVLMPTATILPYAGTTAPTGYLLCDGGSISRTTYSDLFGVIGTTYGSSSTTTFKLPDLRGRVIAGQDDMGGTSANRLTNQSGGLNGDVLGDTGGSETHTLSTAQIPEHDHHVVKGTTVSESGSIAADGYIAERATQTGSTYASYMLRPTTSEADRGLTSGTGGGGSHNNIQPTIILNYIIKT